MSTDVTPRYCFADPIEGGKQAVAEAYRNISATGATPLAITNCLNFGNPERPEIMGQFVGCLDGMGQACLPPSIFLSFQAMCRFTMKPMALAFCQPRRLVGLE